MLIKYKKDKVEKVKRTKIQWPEKLKGLPVSLSVENGNLPIEEVESFALTAHCGTGKTMSVPPAVAILRGEKVVLRQPTRLTARLTYRGLKMFWGDQLKIGIHTSDDDEGSLDDCDIMVVTDGVLRNWLKNTDYRICIIFDEFHWQTSTNEIELGIVKTYLNEGKKFSTILMTATIRPENIITYFEDLNETKTDRAYISNLCDIMENEGEAINSINQKQWLKCFYSEGVSQPIENRIEQYQADTDNQEGTIMQFCQRLYDEKKRGLVFLATRREIENFKEMANRVVPNLPSEFAHADVDIDKIVKFVEKYEPSVLFATIALATSATLPFDEVLIVDRGIDSIYENGFEKTITGVPLPDNGILQRRGRVGRIKPGVCTLVSMHEEHQQWDTIRPRDIIPPLQKSSPEHVVMVCAQYGLDARGIDIMSKLNPYDLDQSVDKLKWLGLVNEDDGTLGLTGLGKRVNALPMDIEKGIIIAQSPKELLTIMIAIESFDQGMFSLFKSRVQLADGTVVSGASLLGDEYKHPMSTMIAKAKILQGAFKARENEETTVTEFCLINGIWPKKMDKIMYQFYQICDRGINKSEKKMRAKLIEADIDALAPKIIEYITTRKVFKRVTMFHSLYKGKAGYKSEYEGFFCTLDGMDVELTKLNNEEPSYVTVVGIPKVIITKSGFEMCIFGDSTIVEEEEF